MTNNIPYWAECDGARYIVISEFNGCVKMTDGLSLPVVPLDTITPLPECTGWDWQPPKPPPKLRDATVEDAIRALRGEVVRFLCRDYDWDQWEACFLESYCKRLTYPWRARRQLSGDHNGWRQCMVEDTPHCPSKETT